MHAHFRHILNSITFVAPPVVLHYIGLDCWPTIVGSICCCRGLVLFAQHIDCRPPHFITPVRGGVLDPLPDRLYKVLGRHTASSATMACVPLIPTQKCPKCWPKFLCRSNNTIKGTYPTIRSLNNLGLGRWRTPVVARFRPPNKLELASGGETIVDFESEDTCNVQVCSEISLTSLPTVFPRPLW